MGDIDNDADVRAFAERLAKENDQLKKDKDALVGELQIAPEDEDAAKIIKARLAKASVKAMEQIEALSSHATSESVRASCSKYILDVTMGRKKLEDLDSSEVANLIKSLKPKKTKSSKEGS